MVKMDKKKATDFMLPLALFFAGCVFMLIVSKLDKFVVLKHLSPGEHILKNSNLEGKISNSELEELKAQIVAEIKEESEFVIKRLSQKIDMASGSSTEENSFPISSVAVNLPNSRINSKFLKFNYHFLSLNVYLNDLIRFYTNFIPYSVKNTINDVRTSLLKLEHSIPSAGVSTEVSDENVRRKDYRGPRQICHYPENEIRRILSMPHDCKRKGKNVFAEGEWTTSSDLSEMTKEKDPHKSDVVCVIACIDHLGVCRDEKCLVPLYMRRGTTDPRVIYQMLEDGELDIIDPQYEFKTVLDAGGNCGIAAALLATMYPRATIVSVEPSSKNYKILRLNTQRFRNVFPVKAALWPRVSKLSLAKGPGNGDEWGFMAYESDKVPKDNLVEDSLQGVSVHFLLDLFNLHSFDLVKMDIEGSEQEVFTEADDNPLAWVMECKMIIVEMHEWMKKGSSEKPRNFFISSKDNWQHTSFGGYEIYKAVSWSS